MILLLKSYPYHFVRTILFVPFCPIPFCPYTILSISFCPYHFVRYHFVLEPLHQLRTITRSLRLLHLQPPPLYMPSLQISFVPRSKLASLLVEWGAWIGFCALLPA